MDADIERNIIETLAVALRVPVATLSEFPSHVHRRALSAVGASIGEVGALTGDEGRFLVCRYHEQRTAVLVLGPYREPDDPDSEIVTLNADARNYAAEVIQVATSALRRAVDVESQRLELATQLEVTSRSVLAVTSELSLDTVLTRIVDLARELSDASYAALGVPGPDGGLEAFLTAGMSPDEEARIPHRPRGLGVLGLLLREPKAIRLRDLSEHPASVGFPKNHPPMTSFLGMPIVSRGRVLGNLYLTEKRTGDEFTDSDTHLVEILARHAAVAIENARLYQELETQQRRLKLILDQLPEAVLLTEIDPERITLANSHASELLGWEITTPMLLEEFVSQNVRSKPDGSELLMENVPMVRSLHEGESVNRREIQIERPDGQRIFVLVNSVPLRGQGGHILGSITVFQDITQIKDAEQLKDDFLSLVSHELRTPLTTIQGGALMLERDWTSLDVQTRQEILTDIATESRRLGGLIENMVQLANIRAGRTRMETEPVLVNVLVNGAIEATRLLEPGREFSVEAEPHLLAEADEGRIDQVVRNLLHNAIKYSPVDTPIEVRARRNDEMIEIGVRDFGSGISETELPLVFDRFHRSEHWQTSSTPGMGLGLYLVRHVIEAHGGRIWVERPEDGGTRMLFTIPAVQDEP